MNIQSTNSTAPNPSRCHFCEWTLPLGESILDCIPAVGILIGVYCMQRDRKKLNEETVKLLSAQESSEEERYTLAMRQTNRAVLLILNGCVTGVTALIYANS